MFSKKALTQTQTIIIALIIIVAAFAGVYYATKPAPTPSPTPTPTPTPTPPEKVVLKIGLDTAYETADPPIWYSDLLNGIGQLVTEPLTRMMWAEDAVPPKGDNKIVPVLAESWERTDELTWVFHIKRGVKFSDGSELTAKDVYFSLWGRQEMRPPNFLWSIDARIESMEIVDDYTIKMKTILPMNNLEAWLVHGWDSIMSYDAVKASGQENIYPIQGVENVLGTGPYMWTEIEPMLYAKMTLNPYWRGEKPQITDIEIYYLPDSDARVAALEVGSVDFIHDVPLEAIEMLRKKDFTIWEGPGTLFRCLALVNIKPPLDDIRVRQALAHAINYDELIETVFAGAAIRPLSVVPPADLGAGEYKYYDYDPEKAKQLLAEAGYADGLKLKMAYRSGGMPHIDEVTAAIQGYFRAVGVTLEADILERSTLHEERIVMRNNYIRGEATVDDINYNIFYGGWFSDTLYAGDDMFSLYRSESDHNYWYYHNEEVDELIMKSVSQAPLEERIEAVLKAQEIMMEDCAMISFYAPPYYSASSPKYTGHIILPNIYEYFLEGKLEK